MACILCKLCEARQKILTEKFQTWFEAQSNNVALMERERDPAAIHEAYDMLETDPAESFRRFLALSENGSVWSMAMLGHLFENGTGTAVNMRDAEQWYERAYQAGSDAGLIRLGDLYQDTGRWQKAQDVFRAGVARDFAPAMSRLASSYLSSPNRRKKRNEALMLLEGGSAAGDLSARQFLARSMARGRFGLRKIPAGFRLFAAVAEDFGKLVDGEMAPMDADKMARPSFLSRLAAKLWLTDASRHSASAARP